MQSITSYLTYCDIYIYNYINHYLLLEGKEIYHCTDSKYVLFIYIQKNVNSALSEYPPPFLRFSIPAYKISQYLFRKKYLLIPKLEIVDLFSND